LTRIREATPVITAVIPAHNEARCLAATLESVQAQEPAPDVIWVVADRCTDDTAAIARAHGAQVFTPYRNTHKKAGGLNQALLRIVPTMWPNDKVLIMDADTILAPDFTAVALRKLDKLPKVGAVGAVFYGEAGHGLLGQLQRNEFTRYSRELNHQRHRDRVRVLSGTASVFRAQVLKDIREARRSGKIPGEVEYYNRGAITEDNEITLAAMSAGWELTSPPQCAVETELMGTVRKLWHQRIRWQRGALENLREYGWTKVTRPYILRQMMMGFSVLALLAYFLFTAGSTARAGHFGWNPWWMPVGAGFVLERTVTVRKGGWKAVALAAPIIPELLYDMFQHAVFLTCVVKSALKMKQNW
jgi:biofilm PGA synthesis N-glycosyltransferase PgaC